MAITNTDYMSKTITQKQETTTKGVYTYKPIAIKTLADQVYLNDEGASIENSNFQGVTVQDKLADINNSTLTIKTADNLEGVTYTAGQKDGTTIILTAASVGLGNVDNTADKDKNVASAANASFAGGAGFLVDPGNKKPLTVGGYSQPVFIGEGLPVACDYIPKLNGSAAPADAVFYAPITPGTSGYVLKSNGSSAPTWGTLTKSDVGLGNVNNTADTEKNVNKAAYLGSGNTVYTEGNANQPVYFAQGKPVAGTSIGKGVLTIKQNSGSTTFSANASSNALVNIYVPKLNGKETENGTTVFYAPTDIGTSGQILESTGTGTPHWVNKPAINDAKLTIKHNGTANTFTANASTDATVDIYVPILNGKASNETFYAPISAGSKSGQFLRSTGGIPEWVDKIPTSALPDTVTGQLYYRGVCYGFVDTSATKLYLINPETKDKAIHGPNGAYLGFITGYDSNSGDVKGYFLDEISKGDYFIYNDLNNETWGPEFRDKWNVNEKSETTSDVMKGYGRDFLKHFFHGLSTGDWIVCDQHSADSLYPELSKVDNTDAISSINSRTGALTIDGADGLTSSGKSDDPSIIKIGVDSSHILPSKDAWDAKLTVNDANTTGDNYFSAVKVSGGQVTAGAQTIVFAKTTTSDELKDLAKGGIAFIG